MNEKVDKLVEKIDKITKGYTDYNKKAVDQMIVQVRMSKLSEESQYIIIDDLFELISAGIERDESATSILGMDPFDYVEELIKDATSASDIKKYDLKSEQLLILSAVLLTLNVLGSTVISLNNGSSVAIVTLNLGFILSMLVDFCYAMALIKSIAYARKFDKYMYAKTFVITLFAILSGFSILKFLEGVQAEVSLISSVFIIGLLVVGSLVMKVFIYNKK